MRHLRDNKKIECRGTEDKIILCRAGYFNLINGYKLPFISGQTENGHTYIRNTNIQEFYQLKKFDDELRMHLLKYITGVEEEVRGFVGYKFDEVNNQGKTEWYNVNAYDESIETQSIIKVISQIYQQVHRSQQSYISHYLKEHKYLPTWILVKSMNFSTFIDFLNCSKDEVKDSICKLYGLQDIQGINDYKLLIGSLHWLRKVRNACAHNERIYGICRENAKINTRYLELLPNSYKRERRQMIMDLIIYMKFYLPHDEYEIFVTEIKSMMDQLKNHINNHSFDKVRADMGIKNISDLDILLSNGKNIEYNKF